jgi:hypothetical protein
MADATNVRILLNQHENNLKRLLEFKKSWRGEARERGDATIINITLQINELLQGMYKNK